MATSEARPGAADADGRIRVEVIRAWPRHFTATAVELPAGATVADALAVAARAEAAAAPAAEGGASGEHPHEVGDDLAAVAIFGERVGHDHVLARGDRIEVLRPLLADPKDARRRRAKK